MAAEMQRTATYTRTARRQAIILRSFSKKPLWTCRTYASDVTGLSFSCSLVAEKARSLATNPQKRQKSWLWGSRKARRAGVFRGLDPSIALPVRPGDQRDSWQGFGGDTSNPGDEGC